MKQSMFSPVHTNQQKLQRITERWLDGGDDIAGHELFANFIATIEKSPEDYTKLLNALDNLPDNRPLTKKDFNERIFSAINAACQTLYMAPCLIGVNSACVTTMGWLCFTGCIPGALLGSVCVAITALATCAIAVEAQDTNPICIDVNSLDDRKSDYSYCGTEDGIYSTNEDTQEIMVYLINKSWCFQHEFKQETRPLLQ